MINGVLYGHAHKALCAGLGNGLDAYGTVRAHIAARKLLDEGYHLRGFGGACIPFDACVEVFRVFAENDHIHCVRILHRAWHARNVAHRTDAGVEVKESAQKDVDRAEALAHRGAQGTLQGHAVLCDGLHALFGHEFACLLPAGLASVYGQPLDLPCSSIGLFHCRIEHGPCRIPDVRSHAVAGYDGNDGIVGDDQFAVRAKSNASAHMFSLGNLFVFCTPVQARARPVPSWSLQRAGRH